MRGREREKERENDEIHARSTNDKSKFGGKNKFEEGKRVTTERLLWCGAG
jgi:hypothetical protein